MSAVFHNNHAKKQKQERDIKNSMRERIKKPGLKAGFETIQLKRRSGGSANLVEFLLEGQRIARQSGLVGLVQEAIKAPAMLDGAQGIG